jgi:hypothetical protein
MADHPLTANGFLPQNGTSIVASEKELHHHFQEGASSSFPRNEHYRFFQGTTVIVSFKEQPLS